MRTIVDDADLVRRLAAGEVAAFDEAYRQYATGCNAIAYRILHDGELARDVVQDAFLTLWRHREGLVIRSAGILPWLSVVTRNAALMALRSDARRRVRESRLREDVVESDPLETVEASSTANEIRAALDTLPVEQRTVIELSYFKQLTLAQIAEQTGVPLGTVKTRVYHALRHLRLILQGHMA